MRPLLVPRPNRPLIEAFRDSTKSARVNTEAIPTALDLESALQLTCFWNNHRLAYNFFLFANVESSSRWQYNLKVKDFPFSLMDKRRKVWTSIL